MFSTTPDGIRRFHFGSEISPAEYPRPSPTFADGTNSSHLRRYNFGLVITIHRQKTEETPFRIMTVYKGST
jgi:hypothetical protein